MSRYWTKYMYYVASTTPEGDPDVVERKWRMLALHVQSMFRTSMTNVLTGNLNERPGIVCG